MIESVNNEKVKYYKKLRDKKYILEFKKYIVEGEHLVNEAYKAGVLEELLYSEGEYAFEKINCVKLSPKVMKSLSNLQSVPSVMGIVRLIQGTEIKGNKIILLDNVQDPGNVGTVIRSALAFNVDTVIFSDDSVTLFNDKMIRASEGTIFNMNVVRMNLKDAIDIVKRNDIKIYYADMHGNENLDDMIVSKYALVLGSEGQGISNYVKEVSDSSIRIPINSNCESLNVAISGGIIMYKFR